MSYAVIIADFGSFIADFGTLGSFQPLICFHPGSHRQSRFALEGTAKGVITAETTLLSQLLSGERAMSFNSIAIETGEVIDSQIVNIGIVSQTLTGEILAEIETIGADGFGKLE